MYNLIPTATTYLKSKPLQSSVLPVSEKHLIYPGNAIKTNVLQDADNNHWRVFVDNITYYIFKPHWSVSDNKTPTVIPKHQLEALKPTVVKRRPVQSADLAFEDKYTLLPGNIITTSYLKEAVNRHWEIEIKGVPWFIYQPHWVVINLGIVLTVEQLQQIYPWTNRSILEANLPFLNKAIAEYKINLTRIRTAYFLAQIGHESGGLRYNLELATGAAYEGRRDLGNVQPGDGPRFKGRGFIQLTGRANYRNAGRALNIDLENNPELARDVRYQSLIAAWFWNSRNLNMWADKEDFLRVTRLINGGYNGLKDRQNYLKRALDAL